ncbi:heme exporter protein CcmD [Salinimonas marina]|uniref:Heme exporter protein D n=1 Tax=Salinimonas marina TaxID=2785918 RepID=A0A7S9HC96_9ALTE|nr:heme exporter protein CcmD [Salinimonas marina]QPG05046.1 heme exporter protein CcmD [Salinimonas marina]
MQFDSLSSFVAMGGYGLYVWLSFGVSFLVMAVLVGSARVERRRLLKSITQHQQRQARIQKARQHTKPAQE